MVDRLNPIIRGWAAYYRTEVSSEVFASLDDYVWKLAYKWAKHSHPRKPKRWVTARYFGMFNKTRRDRWVFGDRASGAYLHKFAWTRIVRHPMVIGTSSPDDPALIDYWDARRRKTGVPVDDSTRRLLTAQNGRCLICTAPLLPVEHWPQTPQQWALWLATGRKVITKITLRQDETSNKATTRLIHTHCRHQPRYDGSTPILSTYEPPRLA